MTTICIYRPTMHDAGENEMRELLDINIPNNNYEIVRNSDVSYSISSENDFNSDDLNHLDAVMKLLEYNREWV